MNGENGNLIIFVLQIRSVMEGTYYWIVLLEQMERGVQVKYKGIKASASCNIEAGDEFSLEFGKNLAKRRLIAKLIEIYANDISGQKHDIKFKENKLN